MPCLAAVLQVGADAYPPLVLQWIETNTGRDLNRGSLYVALDRLENKGLLRSTRGEGSAEREGRPKRYLEVTASILPARRALGIDPMETLREE